MKAKNSWNVLVILKLKQICLILFTLLSFSGFSQNAEGTKFIEVTVTDTLVVVPDVIEYTFVLTPGVNFEAPVAYDEEDDYTQPVTPDYALEQKKKEEELKVTMKLNEKKITDLLEKDKIPYTRKSTRSSFGYIYNPMDIDQKAFVITFKSNQQMEKWLEKIDAEIKYEGKITNTQSTKYKQLETEVLERAFVSARKKAEAIAKLSNAKLGVVLQFSDSIGESLGDAIQQLMYNLPKMYDYRNMGLTDQKIIISKTVRVRFALE